MRSAQGATVHRYCEVTHWPPVGRTILTLLYTFFRCGIRTCLQHSPVCFLHIWKGGNTIRCPVATFAKVARYKVSCVHRCLRPTGLQCRGFPNVFGVLRAGNCKASNRECSQLSKVHRSLQFTGAHCKVTKLLFRKFVGP